MTETAPAPRPHTAVLVGMDADDALGAEFAAALCAQTGQETELRALGHHEEFFAFETDLPPIVPMAAQALQSRLTAEFGARADLAVVPSQGRRKRLLVSDMDSTIIGQECLDELADFAGLKAEVSAITERAMAGELDFEGALTARVAMLKGLGLGALTACFEQRISLNPGARTLVATMRAHGARCVLVSGGFTFFTSRVAAAAGFETHRGNTLIDDGAALTGEVGLPILGREAKLSALQDEAAAIGAGLDATLTLGDGANDLAMIEASGLGIAYRAKPIVAERAHAAINRTSLVSALFFQGYRASDFVSV